jgi:hypothetical protein
MVEESRFSSEQILQTSESEIFLQHSQYLTSLFSIIRALAKSSTISLSCLSKKRAKRSADFLPIPGSFDNCATAFSNKYEG